MLREIGRVTIAQMQECGSTPDQLLRGAGQARPRGGLQGVGFIVGAALAAINAAENGVTIAAPLPQILHET